MKKTLPFLLISSSLVTSSFAVANTCQSTLADQLKVTAGRTCKEGAQEILSTNNHMVAMNGRPIENARYGFFIRCKKGDSYIGLVKLIEPQTDSKSTCKVEIESVSRVSK